MQRDQERGHSVSTVALALGTLGIVYGDIGTSPLYALRESFHHAELTVSQTTTYGVASVVFWALIIIISIKYLLLVMRADNHGEGGILALTALLMPPGQRLPTGVKRGLVALGVFGTALLYGDGLITPAISVLSAVEGFEVATSAMEDWVIPVAIAILVALFLVQRRGTERIARVFSPVMVVWFVVIGVLGLLEVLDHPGVLKAVWPGYAVDFFVEETGRAFLSLGSIFLVVTGGEALYADMGHFGRKPIQLSWYSIVLPTLVLNYFGQAALLTAEPDAIESPFYRLAPDWAITPLAVLATMATVIASQALISGAFSLTVQAVQLDYLPRILIRHTSHTHHGQVYVPLVNWLLMIGCIGLVIGFGTSSNLAGAYGIAVTATMAITTMLFFRIVTDRWGWSRAKALAVLTPLFLVDLAFFAANVPKIPDGGWFPLLVAAVLVTLMTTWRRGRALVAERIARAGRTLADVTGVAIREGIARVPGTGVYLFKDPGRAPPSLVSVIEHHQSLHETTVVLSVLTSDAPHVSASDRAEVTDLGDGVFQLTMTFGFMEEPDVGDALREVEIAGRPFDVEGASYFVGRESVTSTPEPGMSRWREHLFVTMNRSSASASRFFELPAGRVSEVGTPVEI